MSDQDRLQQALEQFFESDSTWMEYLKRCQAANTEVNPDHLLLFEAIPTGSRLLDIGCGPVAPVRMFKEVDYFGLDYSSFALRFAHSTNGGPRRWVRGNAVSLPFADGTFDVVLSLRMIEYIVKPDRFFMETMRVLRPGGLLLLNGPAWEMPHQLPPSARNMRGIKRGVFISKRLGRQLLYQALRRRAYFEVLPETAAVQDGHRVSDDDAAYIVSPYQIERFLKLCGMEVLYRKRDDDRGSWPNCSGLRYVFKKLMLSMPPWTSGFVSCNIIARKPF